MDLNSILDGATDASPKKKKSNTPTKEVTDPKAQKLVQVWLESKKQKEVHEAKQKSAEADLIDTARDFHVEHCTKEGKVVTTVRFMLPDGSNILIDLAKNQYKKISKSSQSDLKEVFGDDMEKYFVPKMDISLTPAALADKEILTKLVKAVGQENFAKYFKVEQVLKPTDAFHQDRFLDSDVKAAFEKASAKKLVEPYSPSFKQGA